MKIRRKRKSDDPPVYRLDPSIRLCPNFNYGSMALFPTAEPGEMGFIVEDNCPEEHMQ